MANDNSGIAASKSHRFDIPQDRKSNGSFTDTTTHEVHVKLANNTKKLEYLPLDIAGFHVQRLTPLRKVKHWNTTTADDGVLTYLDCKCTKRST